MQVNVAPALTTGKVEELWVEAQDTAMEDVLVVPEVIRNDEDEPEVFEEAWRLYIVPLKSCFPVRFRSPEAARDFVQHILVPSSEEFNWSWTSPEPLPEQVSWFVHTTALLAMLLPDVVEVVDWAE